MNEKRIRYKHHSYDHSRIWRLIEAMNKDGFEINICCLPFCQHFPEDGKCNFIVQVQGQRRGGIDVCQWGTSPFDALYNVFLDVQRKEPMSKANDNFYGHAKE